MRKSSILKTYLLLSSLSLIVSCESINNLPDQNTVNIQSNSVLLTKTAIQGWKKHISDIELEGGSIQKDCEPFYKTAKGKLKGSVMLFHGYSGCPQQYKEIATELSNNGFNVFIPLLPGHGQERVIKNGKYSDFSIKLPDMENTYEYEYFAKQMGSILKDESGVKVVGGLSVGGVVAAKAMITNQDVYDRAILMAPFFDASGISSIAIPAVGAVIPNKEIGWGEKCEKERELGRAGYCSFKLSNLVAVRKFGLNTLKETENIKKSVQIIGAEKDPAASNSKLFEASNKIKNSKICFFPKGTTHSMFSRYDNPGVDMFWLNALKSQLIDYVSTGKNFDTSGKSEFNSPLCRFK
jgi:esterase/lipase